MSLHAAIPVLYYMYPMEILFNNCVPCLLKAKCFVLFLCTTLLLHQLIIMKNSVIICMSAGPPVFASSSQVISVYTGDNYAVNCTVIDPGFPPNLTLFF